jgi:hypothetical protein
MAYKYFSSACAEKGDKRVMIKQTPEVPPLQNIDHITHSPLDHNIEKGYSRAPKTRALLQSCHQKERNFTHSLWLVRIHNDVSVLLQSAHGTRIKYITQFDPLRV